MQPHNNKSSATCTHSLPTDEYTCFVYSLTHLPKMIDIMTCKTLVNLWLTSCISSKIKGFAMREWAGSCLRFSQVLLCEVIIKVC